MTTAGTTIYVYRWWRHESSLSTTWCTLYMHAAVVYMLLCTCVHCCCCCCCVTAHEEWEPRWQSGLTSQSNKDTWSDNKDTHYMYFCDHETSPSPAHPHPPHNIGHNPGTGQQKQENKPQKQMRRRFLKFSSFRKHIFEKSSQQKLRQVEWWVMGGIVLNVE